MSVCARECACLCRCVCVPVPVCAPVFACVCVACACVHMRAGRFMDCLRVCTIISACYALSAIY